MSELLGPIYAKNDYAGFVLRMLALLIDLAILVVVLIVALVAYFTIAAPADLGRVDLILDGWILVALAYTFLFRLSERGSPGYRAVGIRYAYMLQGAPDKLWIASRSLWAIVLTLVFGLNHLWILVDPRKQAWHDKLSGFYVVKRRARPSGMQRIVRRVVNFLGYALIVWEPATDDDLKR